MGQTWPMQKVIRWKRRRVGMHERSQQDESPMIMGSDCDTSVPKTHVGVSFHVIVTFHELMSYDNVYLQSLFV